MCKILIIFVLVNLLLTLINESLTTCQSITSNYNLFVYTSLEQLHNISDNCCSHVLYKESGNSLLYFNYYIHIILTLTIEPLITCQSIS